jgi:hypothetical protein
MGKFKRAIPFLLIILLFGCNTKEFEIGSGKVILSFDKKGNINKILLTDNGITRSVQVFTSLKDCRQIGFSELYNSINKSFIISKEWKDSLGNECLVKDIFTSDSGIIHWDIEIEGFGKSWSTAIETHINYKNADSLFFWTSWGDPDQHFPADSDQACKKTWSDPFEAKPFCNTYLTYGEHCVLGASYCIPVISVFEINKDAGFTVALSPRDSLLDMRMTTTEKGEVVQIHNYHRIQKGHTIRFHHLIYATQSDWRSVMAQYVKQFPEYFNPNISTAGEISGLGAYSTYEGKLDVQKFKKMGGIVNWKASYDFPYYGMFIPDVKSDDERYRRFDIGYKGILNPLPVTSTSISQMRNYFKQMHRDGFKSLAYLCITEFGTEIKYPYTGTVDDTSACVKQANEYLYSHFKDAILFSSHDQICELYRTKDQHMKMTPKFHEEPCHSWINSLAMDNGDPVYAAFIVDQVKKHLEKFPDIDGFGIDRMDWLGEYNWKADDGMSMIGGKPVRSLVNSWKSIMSQIGPLIHAKDKGIFVNPHLHRIDVMKETDGIFNEGGFHASKMNMTAMVCMFKPAFCWTAPSKMVNENGKEIFQLTDFCKMLLNWDIDEYLQRHLLMGVFPMAPYPGNDHSILPDPAIEKHYLEYGDMFTAIHGKKYVLIPHVIEVENKLAKANIFETPEGYVVPVVFGKASEVIVEINNLDELLDKENFKAYVIYPGIEKKESVSFEKKNRRLVFKIKLVKGVAVLILK